jgi:hypothetical protein
MPTTIAFLGMLLISMLVALLAVLQLGDFFLASDEFSLIIAGVAGFTAVSLAALATAYTAAERVGQLTAIALLLALLALSPVALPGLVRALASYSTNPYSVGIENTYITIELVVPALLAVLMQWGLVRRRWLREAGQRELSRWPWIATGIGCLVILNPLGLAFVGTTLKHSASDFMWSLTATITGAALGLLLVAAGVECYIRVRMLNRRQAGAPPHRQRLNGGNAEAAR